MLSRSAYSIAAAGAALAIAACGGSGAASSGAGYGAANSPYAMSKCMRANGLTNFPDPRQGSGGVGFPGGIMMGVGATALIVDGVQFSGPALRTAEKACAKYLPPSGPLPVPSASQRRQDLQLAECMRANGVPNFADPTFGAQPGAGAAGKRQIPVADAPAFRHAVQVCGHGGGIHISG
jgi:hypothetical protein